MMGNQLMFFSDEGATHANWQLTHADLIELSKKQQIFKLLLNKGCRVNAANVLLNSKVIITS